MKAKVNVGHDHDLMELSVAFEVGTEWTRLDGGQLELVEARQAVLIQSLGALIEILSTKGLLTREEVDRVMPYTVDVVEEE